MDLPDSSPAVAHSLDFDSGASFSGMTAGSGSHSNPSQNSQQMSLSQDSTSHNGGMTASTSDTTISNGLMGNHEHDPASALGLDATFGPDLSKPYQDDEWAIPFVPKEPKIPRESGDPLGDWKYEMRREAQQIIPGLLVGPYQISRILEPLQKLGITHIVCVYDNREKIFVKPRFPEHFTYLSLEVRDAADQNLIRLFPQVRQFIDEALQAGGRVLVHCGDGISRSPALVIAYLMMTFNVTHEEAFLHVQARRFCASPNVSFQRQIEAYEDIHSASLAMTNYAKTNPHEQAKVAQGEAQSTNRRKRDFALDMDDEEEIDEDLKERNLHAQRKRRGSDEEEEHSFVGEHVMDTS